MNRNITDEFQLASKHRRITLIDEKTNNTEDNVSNSLIRLHFYETVNSSFYCRLIK